MNSTGRFIIVLVLDMMRAPSASSSRVANLLHQVDEKVMDVVSRELGPPCS